MTFLEEASQNPIDFIYGISCPFPNLVQKITYEIFISPNEELDTTVQSLIMVIFTVWQNYLKINVRDHLPEGKFCETSEHVKEVCASVAKHNKFPERVFRLTDSLIRLRQNATEMCNEAFIMFTNNKTNAWLKFKPEKEKLQLLKDAYQFAGKLREQYKQRTKDIAERRMQDLRQKQQWKHELNAKRLKEKEELTNKIVYYGLWQSKEVVRRKLLTISTKVEKEVALKCQLKFRQVVLMHSSSHEYFLIVSREEKV